MKTDDFVHLHTHSDAGSILDGFGRLPEYLARVEAIGQPGLGISDHGSVASIYTLINKAKAMGLTPVPGSEFYVAPQNELGAFVKEPVFYGANGQKAPEYDVSNNGAYTHQTIWAVNNNGLSNLFRLSSLSHEPERTYSKPRIDFNLIADHAEGLVAASGCPSSEISTRLLLGQKKEAYEYAGRMKDVFGERFFVEIMAHDMNINLERKLLPMLLRLAKDMDLPLLATNDAHYTLAEESLHHEEMLCTQSGSIMREPRSDDGGKRFAFDGNQYYLKTAAEMREQFPEEDFPGALSNTLLIAEMAQDVNIEYNPGLRPKAILPPGHTEVTYFHELIEIGFQNRYANADHEMQAEARRRIDEEFEVIYSSNFIGYFLTVYEYINWTRDKFSVRNDAGEVLALSIGAGRGSVGGSILAYILNISEVCPIEHDLLFARFLSAGRGDTYLITYDDGSSEEVIVSEKRIVNGEERYIHQLATGDVVSIDEDDSLEVEPNETIEPIKEIEEEPMIQESSTAAPVVMHTKKEDPMMVTKLGPIDPSSLSDLSKIPF